MYRVFLTTNCLRASFPCSPLEYLCPNKMFLLAVYAIPYWSNAFATFRGDTHLVFGCRFILITLFPRVSNIIRKTIRPRRSQPIAPTPAQNNVLTYTA